MHACESWSWAQAGLGSLCAALLSLDRCALALTVLLNFFNQASVGGGMFLVLN